MIPVHVALVDMSGTVAQSYLQQVAGALNQQIQADFAPAWKVAATVGVYSHIPPDCWRIELHDGIDAPGAAGYHTDVHNQPLSLVDLLAGDWEVTASHELLEMLADPFGNRLHTAAALPGWMGHSPRVRYLLEVCDPCEAITYKTGGIKVSDFLLPGFYRSSPRHGIGYSQTGAIRAPRLILDGGYISWVDPANGHIWQRFCEAGQSTDKDYGVQTLRGSLREFCDHRAREYRHG